MRQAITVDLDTRQTKTLAFLLRQGNAPNCDTPDTNEETVVVQYSFNGGAEWINLWTQTCTTCFTNSPTDSIVVKLPTGAKTRSTRFRWWQPANSGSVKVCCLLLCKQLLINNDRMSHLCSHAAWIPLFIFYSSHFMLMQTPIHFLVLKSFFRIDFFPTFFFAY